MASFMSQSRDGSHFGVSRKGCTELRKSRYIPGSHSLLPAFATFLLNAATSIRQIFACLFSCGFTYPYAVHDGPRAGGFGHPRCGSLVLHHAGVAL